MAYKRTDGRDAMGHVKKAMNKGHFQKYIPLILDFFREHPYPKDSAVHKFAEEDLKLEPDDLEEIIYSILSSFFSEGKSKSGVQVNDEQLAKGIKVEMEHTTNAEIAKKIALDHLAENPAYYDYLEEMEKEMKEEEENGDNESGE
jgi:hypothetical protein